MLLSLRGSPSLNHGAVFSVDLCGEGDVDPLHASPDGGKGVLYLGQHPSGDGAVGLVVLEVGGGDDGDDAVVVVGVGEHAFFSKEKMSVTS